MAFKLYAEMRIVKQAMYNFYETKLEDPCLIMDQFGKVEAEMENHCIEHGEIVEEWPGYSKTVKYWEKFKEYKVKLEEKERKRKASAEKKRIKQAGKEAKRAASAEKKRLKKEQKRLEELEKDQGSGRLLSEV